MHSLSPDDEGHDELLFPATEHLSTQQEQPLLTSCTVSSMCEETQVEREGWNISGDKPEDPVVSGSAGGGDDMDTVSEQPESETVRLLRSSSATSQESRCDAHSPRLERNVAGEGAVEQIVGSESVTAAATGQMSSKERETQGGVNENEGEGREHGTLVNEMGTHHDQLLGTDSYTSFERNVILSPTCVEGEIYDGDREGQTLSEQLQTAEHPPGTENKTSLVGCHADRPEKIWVSLDRRDHHRAETELDQSDNSANNLKKAIEDKGAAMEGRSEVETQNETKTGSDTSTEDLCSGVCSGEKQCETKRREPEERDRNESPFDERTPTGMYNNGLISQNRSSESYCPFQMTTSICVHSSIILTAF